MIINGHLLTLLLSPRSCDSIGLHVDGLAALDFHEITMGFKLKICWCRMKCVNSYNLICETQGHSKPSDTTGYNNLIFRNWRLTVQEIFPWQKMVYSYTKDTRKIKKQIPMLTVCRSKENSNFNKCVWNTLIRPSSDSRNLDVLQLKKQVFKVPLFILMMGNSDNYWSM